MVRVKRGVAGRVKRKKILKYAKGFKGVRSTLYRAAKEAVWHAWRYAYVGRKLKKRDFRRLWTARLNAAAREHGLPYNRFMHGLKLADVKLNRKMLSELAIHHPDAFEAVADSVKNSLSGT